MTDQRIGLWKSLEVIFGAASLVIALADLWLWNRYAATFPSLADATAGRVYPLNTHGHIVFLTTAEHTRLYALIFSSVTLFLVAVLIDMIKKPFRE